jgi:murein peptide amidase A
MAEELKASEKFVAPQAVFDRFAGLGEIGRSAGAQKPGAKRILFLGGVHGNETEGVAATQGFFDEFAAGEKRGEILNDVFFVPVVSPDGFLACSRHNAHGVDLNRNMATRDWKKNDPGEKYYSGPAANSEPETLLLLKLLETFRPEFILSLHSWKPMFNINGPARRYAEKMQAALSYEITEYIGYPTPGSLGTYAGWERGIPTITFEIERGLPLADVYPTVRGAILAALA